MTEAPKLSLKEKQWNLREDAILDAASELMSSKGYNAMTMDDVANLVGISKATLYIHFPSKHDLVVSVACRTLDQAYEQIAAIDPDLAPAARVRELVNKLIDCRYGAGAPPFIEAIGELIEVLATEPPFIERDQRNLSFIGEILTSAKNAKVLVEGIDVLVAVHIIIGTLRCVELQQILDQKKTTPEAIGDTLIRMLLKPGV